LVSSPSLSAHYQLFDHPPEEHPGKNGAAADEREELGASIDATVGSLGMATALPASSSNGREAPDPSAVSGAATAVVAS
jgi:hypothetical protein